MNDNITEILTSDAEQVEQKSLEEVLPLIFSELTKFPEQEREVDDLLGSVYRIPRGSLKEILINPEKFDVLDGYRKIQFLISFHKIMKLEIINPFNFYSQNKINKALKYREQQESLSFPVVYEDVSFGSEVDYKVKMSLQDIAKAWTIGLWTYNPLLQRAPVKSVSKFTGKVKETPKINKNNVVEIRERMHEDKYKPDTITVNVLNDGTDELFYNPSTRELTIESATEINLVDGFHRMTALLAEVEANPSIEGYLWVSIRNYDFDEAEDFLGQHNSFTTFDKTHVRQLKSSKLPDKIIKDILAKSDLKGKVPKRTAVQRKFKELTNFAVLSDSVEYAFKPETGKDRIDISYALIRFFDYLLGSYKEAFDKNIEGVLKTSWINHHNTFVGYVIICARLFEKYGKDFPVDEIVRIVDSINFSKEGSEYNDLMTTQGKVNSNQVKIKIRKFFEDKINELLK